MTVKYADLASEVLPYLVADPSAPLTEREIRRAASEFCARSWVWRFVQDAIAVTIDEPEYDLEPDTGAAVVTVLSVSLDGKDITSVSTDALSELDPNWRAASGEVKHFTQLRGDQIILWRKPNSPGSLVITLAQQPELTSKTFPKWLWNKYGDAIVAGALSRLMSMAGRPWANPQDAVQRKADFEAAIANAKAEAVGGFARAVLRTSSQH